MRTQIEWVRNENGSQGYTINPVKGLCPVDCKDNQGKSYCYARRMYKRFKWNPEVRFEPEEMLDAYAIRKPSKFFVGSTFELFGDWVHPSWLNTIFQSVKANPQHTFIFLTKRPVNLPKAFPSNCWVGVSATNIKEADNALRHLYEIKAKVRFVSFEPLLGWQPLFQVKFPRHLDWVIVGAQTPYSSKTAPKIEWVNEIVDAADKVGIPVFQKNNLTSLLGNNLRQEFPK